MNWKEEQIRLQTTCKRLKSLEERLSCALSVDVSAVIVSEQGRAGSEIRVWIGSSARDNLQTIHVGTAPESADQWQALENKLILREM